MRELFAKITTPTATTLIIAVNAVVFVCVHIFGDWSEWLLSRLSFPPEAAQVALRPWSPLTYMFTQYAPLHLIANMVLLYFYASPMVRGGRRLTALQLWGLYTAGGLGGALIALMACHITHFPSAGLVGASAAVLAVMAYTTLRMPRLKAPLVFFGMVELRVLTLILVLLIIIATGPSAVDIQAAHAGGFLTGVAIALTIKPKAIHALPSPTARNHSTPAPSRPSAEMPDGEMLDILLDKIRRSGYNSLTEEERRLLHQLSQRIHQ